MHSGFDAMTIADAIYGLCAATSLAAALLLLRHYSTRRTPLLLWSCISFFGLAVSNTLLLVDLALLPQFDLAMARTTAGAIAMVTLIYGLIRETGS
jgi:uncharacterized membrane protein